MFALLYKYVILALFMLTINYLINCVNHVKRFLSTVNKCTITIMMIAIISVKSFVERYFFREFNQQFSKINVPL